MEWEPHFDQGGYWISRQRAVPEDDLQVITESWQSSLTWVCQLAYKEM